MRSAAALSPSSASVAGAFGEMADDPRGDRRDGRGVAVDQRLFGGVDAMLAVADDDIASRPVDRLAVCRGIEAKAKVGDEISELAGAGQSGGRRRFRSCRCRRKPSACGPKPPW